MIRLQLRFSPTSRSTDLAWFASQASSLATLSEFFLRAEITAELDPGRMGPEDLARVVDGQLAEHGSPLVRGWSGSSIIELGAPLTGSSLPARALLHLGVLFAQGPELASWPAHVKSTWYERGRAAEEVQAAYRKITMRSAVDVVDDVSGPPILTTNDLARENDKGRRGSRKGALPGGVRRADPLNSPDEEPRPD